MKQKALHILLFLLLSLSSEAQNKIRVYGYVLDTENRGIELANVYIENSRQGSITNSKGYYELSAEIGDSAKLVYSMLGYETIKYSIFPVQKIFRISVELRDSINQISDINVVANHSRRDMLENVDHRKFRLQPNVSGGIESILISFTGVSTHNELSSQYNVRGGNFDENSVYVNGIEIYRPILIRSGQQEGLSFINSDLVEQLSFSSGAFSAEFGDKMSSVLNIKYKKPTKTESSLSMSLLGASAYVGTKYNKFSQLHGIRYKTTANLLNTLDTKAEYSPNFLDYQTALTYDFSPHLALSFLGNISQNSYHFVPQRRETSFGTIQMARKLMIYFSGKEEDLFRTFFGAFTLNYQPSQSLNLSLSTSSFQTDEKESYDISAEYILNEKKMKFEEEAGKKEVLGIGRYHQHARNKLKAKVLNIEHKGVFNGHSHQIKWGLSGQRESFTDKISEWEWRDSAGYSLPHGIDKVDLYYTLKSNSQMSSWRTTAFVQNRYNFNSKIGHFALTSGVRANFWSFNKELLLSPRVSLSFIPYNNSDLNLRLAGGLYFQAPFYKELRDTISDPQGNVTVLLNKNLRAQRSLQIVAGADYDFRAFGRPFKFTTEAYLKPSDRVISYSVDNVNIRYSGKNDAIAYTAGIDFKLFGELVPGTDSWINFSLLSSKEKLIGDISYMQHTYDENRNIIASQKVYPGWVSRPNEKRYAFSMLFQDYWPTNPKYKVNLRLIWSDGLPFGVPRSQQHRAVFRSNSYKRVDIGASRSLISGKDKIMNYPILKHLENIWFNVEVFNLLNFKNENSFYWVTDIYNQQMAVPNYLSGRQFNIKISLDFK